MKIFYNKNVFIVTFDQLEFEHVCGIKVLFAPPSKKIK